MKIAQAYNWIILGYLVMVTILTLNGNLAYGRELGDITYLFAAGLMAISQLTITLIIYRKQKGYFDSLTFYAIGTFFLLIAIWLTWNFTLGRGSEYRWNGKIFLHSPF